MFLALRNGVLLCTGWGLPINRCWVLAIGISARLGVFSIKVQLYIHVACVALAVFDHMHTLPLEVEYVWTSRLTTVTILYYITKYGIYIDYSIQIFRDFSPSIANSPERCLHTSWAIMYTFDTCIWAGEALLGLRVWAVYRKDTRLTLTMPVIFIALFTSSLVTLGTFLKSAKYGQSPAPHIINCFIIHANLDVAKAVACVVAWVAFMCLLLAISALRAYKSGGNSQFVQMIYSDGIQYYAYTLILHVGNLVAFFVGPRSLPSILTRCVMVLTSFFFFGYSTATRTTAPFVFSTLH